MANVGVALVSNKSASMAHSQIEKGQQSSATDIFKPTAAPMTRLFCQADDK